MYLAILAVYVLQTIFSICITFIHEIPENRSLGIFSLLVRCDRRRANKGTSKYEMLISFAGQPNYFKHYYLILNLWEWPVFFSHACDWVTRAISKVKDKVVMFKISMQQFPQWPMWKFLLCTYILQQMDKIHLWSYQVETGFFDTKWLYMKMLPNCSQYLREFPWQLSLACSAK